MGGVHDHGVDDARGAEPDQGPVVAGNPAPAALPPVHDLALVPERVRAERGPLGTEQVLLLAEELIAGGDHPGTQAPGGQVHMRVRHCLVSSLPAGAAPAARPRSQVLRTTPVSVWPAYGVTGCRCSSRLGSTVNRAVSSNATRSASRPRAIAPLPGSSASPAVSSAIHRTTSARPCPRRRAWVHTAGRPSWSEEIPPHAAPKSPVSRCFRPGGQGEWSDTTTSISPLASPAHRPSRCAESLMGGQHLNSVAPSDTSPALNVR